MKVINKKNLKEKKKKKVKVIVYIIAHLGGVQVVGKGELEGDELLVLADERVHVQLTGADTLLGQWHFDDELVFADDV